MAYVAVKGGEEAIKNAEHKRYQGKLYLELESNDL